MEKFQATLGQKNFKDSEDLEISFDDPHLQLFFFVIQSDFFQKIVNEKEIGKSLIHVKCLVTKIQLTSVTRRQITSYSQSNFPKLFLDLSITCTCYGNKFGVVSFFNKARI